MKKITFLYLTIFVLLFFLTLSLYIIFDFKFITSKTSIKDILIKVLPPLFGAFFSGLVALLVFSLTKRKEEINATKKSNDAVEIIKVELKENFEFNLKLNSFLESTPTETIVKHLCIEPNQEVKEYFKMLKNEFSTDIIDEVLEKVSFNTLTTILPDIKSVRNIKKIVDLINTEIQTEKTITQSINRLKETSKLFSESKLYEESTKRKFMKLNRNNFKELYFTDIDKLSYIIILIILFLFFYI